mmetsp:Transcript_15248/g.46044  ORF Transcript_15248/g.46044 Transcript_15248/m.46044 type:complete len:222 (+) Transcript_15248:8336-9001(+)
MAVATQVAPLSSQSCPLHHNRSRPLRRQSSRQNRLCNSSTRMRLQHRGSSCSSRARRSSSRCRRRCRGACPGGAAGTAARWSCSGARCCTSTWTATTSPAGLSHWMLCPAPLRRWSWQPRRRWRGCGWWPLCSSAATADTPSTSTRGSASATAPSVPWPWAGAPPTRSPSSCRRWRRMPPCGFLSCPSLPASWCFVPQAWTAPIPSTSGLAGCGCRLCCWR